MQPYKSKKQEGKKKMEGRSSDNDGEQQGETIILVRGMKSNDSGYDDGKRRHYRGVEFHKVDLNKQGGGEVEKNCYPKLLIWVGRGEMLRSGPKLCIIGGLTESQPHCKDMDEYYTCASVLDIIKEEEEEEKSWKQFPVPIKHQGSYHRCASLDGKIYHFEYPSEAMDPPEGYDPDSLGVEFIWCPEELADCSVSGRVVPDPRNKRILVNLSDGQLYAYYPLDGTFKLVGGNVHPWSYVVALADDVAYVYQPESSGLLYAFDLSDGAKSLDVVWTSKVLSDTVNGVSYNNVKLTSYEFDALFHVGNNNFWFAIWSPDYRGNVNTYFFKFKVRRAGDKIICTPLALRAHLLESTDIVIDFILLEEEACG